PNGFGEREIRHDQGGIASRGTSKQASAARRMCWVIAGEQANDDVGVEQEPRHQTPFFFHRRAMSRSTAARICALLGGGPLRRMRGFKIAYSSCTAGAGLMATFPSSTS